MPGSGTTAEPKLGALLPPPLEVKAPEADPLMKVTVEPAPISREARVWLMVPNFRLAPSPTVTAAAPGAVPRRPLTLVVPALAMRAS